ncbi:hypothetical protein RIVM261_088730 [Rivularia sp. IAM M-261]|nr:hypothetical protein RIVM261_088730 [Rivularia sp. IAM M-261]
MSFPKYKRFPTFLILTVLVNQVTIAQTPINLHERAKLKVSKITGIPTDKLTIVKEARLADTGITKYKLIDTQNNIYGISLNPDGSKTSEEALNQAIQAINNTGFVGKLEAELANRINQGNNKPINVVIWLKNRDIQRLSNLNIPSGAFLQEPLINLLKENNQQIILQSSYAPVVVAAVTPSLIKKIAERSDVERIYLERRRVPR